MKKNDVKIGEVYVARVSGQLVRVRLDDESPYGGWYATNLVTGRRVYVHTAGRLRKHMWQEMATPLPPDVVKAK